MGFSRQVYWSELPFPSPEDLPDPGIEPRFPSLEADASPPEPRGKSYLLKQEYKNSGTLNTHTHTHTRAGTHTHIRARAHTHIRTRTHTHIHTHTRAGTHTHTCTHTHTHTHTYARGHTHAHTHTHIHTHTRARAHTHTHMRTHTHTHTCTHTPLFYCLPSLADGLIFKPTQPLEAEDCMIRTFY